MVARDAVSVLDPASANQIKQPAQRDRKPGRPVRRLVADLVDGLLKQEELEKTAPRVHALREEAGACSARPVAIQEILRSGLPPCHGPGFDVRLQLTTSRPQGVER